MNRHNLKIYVYNNVVVSPLLRGAKIELQTPEKIPQMNQHTFMKVQGDSKRWTQFRTSIFPELYVVCE
jgi:hypothetical protein